LRFRYSVPLFDIKLSSGFGMFNTIYISLLFTFKKLNMKALKLFSLAAVCMTFAISSSAQTKTENFKVSGNCGMCKTKIEKAAKEAGAKEANWDVDSKMLTVTYKSSTTNTAKIQEKIAAVGYDNPGFKSTAEAYNKLHGCCKYEREAGAASDAKADCCSGGATCKEHAGGKHAGNHDANMECCKDGKCSKAGHDGKDCCKKDGAKMDCCKDGKCSKAGHDGKDCCKSEDGKMDCCKEGKCSKAGHDGKDCCKSEDGKMACCKDGKCSKEGHSGGDCCKKS
jgi:mercuric ion binding protein